VNDTERVARTVVKVKQAGTFTVGGE